MLPQVLMRAMDVSNRGCMHSDAQRCWDSGNPELCPPSDCDADSAEGT